MRAAAKLAIVVLASAPLLQACQMFGGGDSRQRASLQRNGDCARLAPLATNADGSLSRADMEASLKLEFKKWDKDGNSELNQAEVVPVNDALRAQNVGASPVMDWNGDGHVNFQEFAGGWRTMFDLCGRGDVVTKADMSRSPNVTPPRTVPTAPKPDSGKSSPQTGGQ